MKCVSVLSKFFNDGSYDRPKVGLGEFTQEIKSLSIEERNELGALAAVELGVDFEPSVPKAA